MEGETEAPNKKQQPCHPCGCPGEPSLKSTALGQHPAVGDPGPERGMAGICSFILFTQILLPTPAAHVWGAPGSQDAAPRSAALHPAPPPKVTKCGRVLQSRGLPTPGIYSHPALEATGVGRVGPLCGGGSVPGPLLAPLGMETRWASYCPVFPGPVSRVSPRLRGHLSRDAGPTLNPG